MLQSCLLVHNFAVEVGDGGRFVFLILNRMHSLYDFLKEGKKNFVLQYCPSLIAPYHKNCTKVAFSIITVVAHTVAVACARYNFKKTYAYDVTDSYELSGFSTLGCCYIIANSIGLYMYIIMVLRSVPCMLLRPFIFLSFSSGVWTCLSQITKHNRNEMG